MLEVCSLSSKSAEEYCPINPPMEKYRLIKEIGDGTCGNVYRAVNVETNEIVAVKKMKRKFYYWEECVNLREVKSLRELNHPNIVKLKEIVSQNHELFFIFEHMEYNLYQIMRDRRNALTEKEIKNFVSQVLEGLSYMHKNGYFHRDMKPENLLVTNDTIKIGDFGLAREIMSKPPYTDYVSTRWYRAPEVLLHSSSYTPAIDMWAVGAILAELFTLSPLFPGESETDQLYKICSVLGNPDYSTWPEGMDLCRSLNFRFFQIPPANLSDIIPSASLEAIDLISKLCSWDPQRRPTAEEALQHPFFHVERWVPFPLQDHTNATPKLELKLWDFGTESDDCFLGLTLAVKPSLSGFDTGDHSSHNQGKELLFRSGYQHHSRPVFWPLLSKDCDTNDAPVMSSLSSSYSINSSPMAGPTGRVPETSGFSIPSVQPNLFDGYLFGQMITHSSPIQQGNFFQ